MNITLILLITLLPGAVIGAAGTGLQGVTPSAPALISVTSSAAGQLSIEYRFDPAWQETALTFAEIPVITRWIALPDAGEPTLESFHLTPAFPLLLGRGGARGGYRNAEPINDHAFRFRSDGNSPVQLGEPIICGGVRLAPLTFQPLFEGDDNKGTAVASAAVVVQLPAGEIPLYRMRPTQREMWGSLILNRDHAGRDQSEETAEGGYICVLPDNNDVRNAIAPLLDWRRQQGYYVREVAVANWAGADWIFQQLLTLNTAEAPLDYILIAGDVEGAYSVPTLARGVQSDYYFSFLEGNDWIPDAAVGRLSFNSIPELQRIVAKILSYERRPDIEDAGWLRRGAVAAGSAQSGLSTILVSRWLRDRMLAYGFTSVDTLWFTMGGSIAEFMRDTFERGSMFVTYRGWTGLEDWSPADALQLRNRYLPVTLLIACNSGDYSGQGAGFTEALLRADGGAIGAIGVAGAQSRINFNNALIAGYFRGVLEDGAYRLGWTLNRARLELMATYGDRARELTVDHSAWTNLMGDPATIIWRGTPRAVSITAPNEADYGAGILRVAVADAQEGRPLPGVRVGLSKGSEIAAGAITDQEGQATIRFDPRRVSPGAATVTASGDRILPSSVQTQVGRPVRQIVVQSFSVRDDENDPRHGNGNGIANPLETIGLNVSVTNIGAQVVAAPITCRLATDAEVCEVRQGEVVLQQQIAPNGVALGAFLVALGGDFPDREPVPFTLTVTAGEQEWISSLNLSGRGPRWEIIGLTLRAAPAPGDVSTFDIRLMNRGSINIGTSQGMLESLGNQAVVVEADGDYDSLAIGRVALAGEVYTVRFEEEAVFGAVLPFRLNIESEEGFTAALPFAITLQRLPPTEPTGPDTYGYWAFDQVDWAYGFRPDYRWVELNPHLGGPGRNTGLLDQGEDDDKSVVLPLPFTFQYYGREYRELTVCTNGWAAFGAQADYVDFRNMPIGSPQGPRAQLCPWWDDLYQPGAEAAIYYHYDAPLHRFIVEWYQMRRWIGPAGPGATETFEIILNDPAWYQNTTGDADFFFQYAEVTHEARVDANGTPYATIGIGDPDDRGGLQIGFWNSFAPGVARPAAGSAIRFATAHEFHFGMVKGVVRRAADDAPIAGASIRATRGGWTFTGQNGAYRLRAVIADMPQRIEVTAAGYNSRLSDEFQVATGDSAEILISLLRPQLNLDLNRIVDSLEAGEEAAHRFNVVNQGDGRLEMTLGIAEPAEDGFGQRGREVNGRRDEPDRLGDRLLHWAATDSTGDSRILGVAFNDDHFIVSGGNNGAEENFFYHFDQHGRYLDRSDQPGRDLWGLHDLAWDGRRLYGGCAEWIYVMDAAGHEVARLSSPLIPARCVAVDPSSGEIWIANDSQPIRRLSAEGETLRSFSHNLHAYGMAWHPADPDGCPLWIFSADGATGLAISKLDSATGTILPVLEIEGEEGDRPGGCELTRRWDDRKWVFVAVIQNATGDRVELYDAGSNLSWASIAPLSAVADAGQGLECTVTLNSEGIEGGDYRADVVITHNAAGGEVRLPIELNVDPMFAGVEYAPPTRFALEGVYPNPSNGAALIRFTLPASGPTELAVYDAAGRVVRQLVTGELPAGSHREVLNAASLPAGVYLIRLRTPQESLVRKFALVK